MNFLCIYNRFYIIAKISKVLGGAKTFFGIYALAAFLPVCITVKKEYRIISYVLVMFLYLTSLYTTGLNIIKQAAAVSICFYGLRYVYSRQLGRYILTIVVAMLFHASAAIAIVNYFLWSKYRRNISLKTAFLVIIGSIVLAFAFRKILQVLTTFSVFSKFAIYIESEIMANNNLIFVHMLVFVFLFLIKKPMISMDRRNALLYLLVLIGICLEFSGFFVIYVKRIAMYFYDIPSIVLLAQTPLLIRGKEKTIMYAGVLIFGISLFVIQFAILGHAHVIPYRI